MAMLKKDSCKELSSLAGILPGARYRRGFFLALCWVFAAATYSFAHECGPTTLTLKVGQVVNWRITADRTEVTSSYIPTYTGDIIAANVAPAGSFEAHHGDFTITGVAPGTATLAVDWYYAPTETGATCAVEVTVEAEVATGEETGTGTEEGTGNGTDGETGTGGENGSSSGGESGMDKPATADGSMSSGRLSTYQGSTNSIAPRALSRMIEYYIPAEAKKLLIFAQCFGGDVACSPHFNDMANTSIASGTSPGQQAKYGGYHDDAARGLSPGEGRTAEDVHDAGDAGKYEHYNPNNPGGVETDAGSLRNWSEMPVTSGACPLGEFSLAHTSVNGEVQSRHIVIYAGKPDTGREPVEDRDGITVPTYEAYLDDQAGGDTRREFTDADDRDAIERNFEGEVNTDVTSVGGAPDPNNPGSGQDGWDHPGNLDGLEAALKKAGAAIRNSPNPDKEQFILFVTDHGEGELYTDRTTNVPSNTRSSVAPQFSSFAADAFIVEQMQLEPQNEPGFSLFLDYSDNPRGFERLPGGAAVPMYEPGTFRLAVTPAGGAEVVFDDFFEQVVDLNDDGIIGSSPGEGIDLRFRVSEDDFLQGLVGMELDIALVNNAPEVVKVVRVGQLSGAIGQRLPPPGRELVDTAVAAADGLPVVSALGQNYPNPFNAATTIAFSLARAERVELVVYNSTGQKVRTLADGFFAAGRHLASWDGKTDAGKVVASGVYVYRFTAGAFRTTRQLVLLK